MRFVACFRQLRRVLHNFAVGSLGAERKARKERSDGSDIEKVDDSANDGGLDDRHTTDHNANVDFYN